MFKRPIYSESKGLAIANSADSKVTNSIIVSSTVGFKDINSSITNINIIEEDIAIIVIWTINTTTNIASLVEAATKVAYKVEEAAKVGYIATIFVVLLLYRLLLLRP